MRKAIGLGLLLALLPASAGAYTINLDTDYLPDAWHLEFIGHGTYNQGAKTYVNGEYLDASQTSNPALLTGNLELGLGNGTSLSANFPYSLTSMDTRGLSDYSIGLAKKVLPWEIGGWKTKLKLAVPQAMGLKTWGIGLDNAFAAPLFIPQLLFSSNLNYYYPLKQELKDSDGNPFYYFRGDRLTYGCGLEYWFNSSFTLGLETIGNYQGITKKDGAPVEQDGTPYWGNTLALAPGFTLALGPNFALQGSYIRPVVRAGYAVASPDDAFLFSTIMDF